MSIDKLYLPQAPPINLQVFGLKAEEILRGKTKCYVLVNMLPAEAREGLIKW